MYRGGCWLAAVVAIALWSAVPASAAPTTTLQRTIRDCNGDNLLEFTNGEPYIDLATQSSGAEDSCSPDGSGTRPHLPAGASILNFLQLSDFQTVDEESPGRVEAVDTTQRVPGLNPLSAAYRPQEPLSTQGAGGRARGGGGGGRSPPARKPRPPPGGPPASI